MDNSAQASPGVEEAEAVDLRRQITKQNPKNADAFFNLGIAFYNNENYEDALAAYKEAIRLQPDNAMALEYLGDTYYLLKNQNEALAAYQKALQMKADLKIVAE